MGTTICNNKNCKMRDCCFVFLKIPGEYQSWTTFDYDKNESCFVDILEGSQAKRENGIYKGATYKELSTGETGKVKDFVYLLNEDDRHPSGYTVDRCLIVQLKNKKKIAMPFVLFKKLFERCPK